jgi:hypothetical protein
MSGWGYGDIYPEYDPGATSNHTHPNDPETSEQVYCYGHGEAKCDKRLDENTATRLSAEQGQCKQCYELDISENPILLKRCLTEIRSSEERLLLFLFDRGTTILQAQTALKKHIETTDENLNVIERYLENFVY